MTEYVNKREASLAIVSIMRGEAIYIHEWVAYYRSIGLKNITIYDNGDNNDTLVSLEREGIITRILWPSIEGISPQLSAYNDAVERLRGDTDFVAFFDADEFLCFDPDFNLLHWLASLMPDVGAVTINQRVFGSGGQLKRSGGLVIERFRMASAPDHPEGRWGKSIYRLKSVIQIDNSHRGRVHGRHILTSGVDAFEDRTNERSYQTCKIDYSISQLNHYILKSYEEFLIKRQRGAVSNATADARATRYKDKNFFWHRDEYCNSMEDLRIQIRVEGVKCEMVSIGQENKIASTKNDVDASSEIGSGTTLSIDDEGCVGGGGMFQGHRKLDFEPWTQKTTEDWVAQKAYQVSISKGNNFVFGEHCYISPLSYISGSIKIGHSSYVAANAVLRGSVRVGSHCAINTSAHLAGNISIGDGVRIAHSTSIIGFNHACDRIDVPIYQQGLSHEGVVIGDNCWIGANAVILDGVNIGAESVIGAGAVVTSSCPPFSILVGNPARITGNRAMASFANRSKAVETARHHPVRSKIFVCDPYASFEDFRPFDLQGWGSYEPIFEELLRELKPRLVVEIGTWKGASAIHQAKIVQSIGLECEIVCVDTWLGNWQHWSRGAGPGSLVDLNLKSGFPTLFNQFMSNVLFSKMDHIITPLPLPSLSAVKLLEHHKIAPDLVYVDGDHEYEAVSQDISCWYERLAPGGVLFGDDFHWPGVRRAVEEFAEKTKVQFRLAGGKFVFTPRSV